jgi:hypothetical protein
MPDKRSIMGMEIETDGWTLKATFENDHPLEGTLKTPEG